MTAAYDIERLVVALESVATAASTVAKRADTPAWLVHRASQIRGEAQSLADIIREHCPHDAGK